MDLTQSAFEENHDEKKKVHKHLRDRMAFHSSEPRLRMEKHPHFMTKKTFTMRQADNVIIQHVPCTKGFATGLQMNAIYKRPLPIENDMPYFTA